VTRKVNREVTVLLGWGRAILLQLAHPLVAAGVAGHSDFSTGLGGYLARARRTVGAMLTLTFGTEDEARRVAARINAIHDRVSGTLDDTAGVFRAGTPYSARHCELLRWVHATLLDSLPLAYETFVGPLTSEERNQYCFEAAAMAHLLRIPEGLLPSTNAELQAYLREMYASDCIHVSQMAQTLARQLLCPPGAASYLFRVPRLVTIGLLPAPIREAYGFRWSAKDAAAFGRWARAIKRTRSITPPILREWPYARLADG
jgi:uncharacterized protein (DUF2236 family)